MARRLKIAIADDEQMICVVLREAIDFERHQLDLVGVAHDGSALLALVREHRPDIVITDIAMPGLSGLDVIGQVRDEGIPCHFVIISGYSQFDFARNALKHRVDDYLLKPIDDMEVNDVLSRIAGQIRTQNEVDTAASNALERSESNTNALRRLYVQRLTANPSYRTEASDLAREYNLTFSRPCFQAIAVKICSDGQATVPQGEALESAYAKLTRIFSQVSDEAGADSLSSTDKRMAVLVINLPAMSKRDTDKIYQRYLAESRDFLSLFKGLRVAVGVGGLVDDLADLPVSIQQARRAVESRLRLGESQALHYGDLAREWRPYSEDRLNQLKLELGRSLESLSAQEFAARMSAFLDEPGIPVYQMVDLALDMVGVARSIELSMSPNDSVELSGLESVEDEVTSAGSLAELKRLILASFTSLIERQATRTSQQRAKPIRDAMAFIQSNYSKRLSLELVSEEVHISPSYFSAFFKQEAGCNFLDYVNGVRIDRAKELLRSTNESVQAISLSVGFADPKHFAKLFKRVVGLKPTEYRTIYG